VPRLDLLNVKGSATLETGQIGSGFLTSYVENIMKNEAEKPSASLGAQIMMASELGSSIVVLSIAGYFAGAWLDGQLHWSPYGVIVGISVGFGLGIAYILKRSNDMDKKS